MDHQAPCGEGARVEHQVVEKVEDSFLRGAPADLPEDALADVEAVGLDEVQRAGEGGELGLDLHDLLAVLLTFDVFVDLVGDGFDGV